MYEVIVLARIANIVSKQNPVKTRMIPRKINWKIKGTVEEKRNWGSRRLQNISALGFIILVINPCLKNDLLSTVTEPVMVATELR